MCVRCKEENIFPIADKLNLPFAYVRSKPKSHGMKNMIEGKLESGKKVLLGLRKILNFGHTIGHAIETTYLNKYNKMLHGEAISIGLMDKYL